MPPIFRNLRLRGKFILSFTAIICLATAIVGIMTWRAYVRSEVESARSYSRSLVEQVAVSLPYKARDLESRVTAQLRFSDAFSRPAGAAAYATSNFRIDETFRYSLSQARAEVREIYCERENLQNYYYAAPGTDIATFDKSSIFQYVVRNRASIRADWGRPRWISIVPGGDTLYMVKAMYSEVTTEYQGIACVGIGAGFFADLYASLGHTRGGSLIILGGDWRVLVCDSSLVPLARAISAARDEAPFGPAHADFDQGGRLVSGCSSADGRWRVLALMDSRDVLRGARALGYKILLSCVLAILAAGSLGIAASGGVTADIRALVDQVRRISSGDFEARIGSGSHDEVGELAASFDTMSERLQVLIQEISAEQAVRKESDYKALQAEFAALQAQINPHFLYNVLESINSHAKLHGQTEIAEIASALGLLLRASIKGRATLIPLSEELEYVRRYLFIQASMLGGRLEVAWDIEEAALGQMVPKLILEPLVENAIVHGIEAKREGGTVAIVAYREAGALVLSVSDNGPGIEAERLRALLAEDPEGRAHIGLANARKRMEILYGPSYGLGISSEPGVGTTVELRLPAEIPA